ncbi:transmembrane protein [Perilla frutescens var. hirtella]|uniref:Transmembrane protein n=1 Tax=Perilla frutescens var. hirtella TaxID=608512 RepID=A0AAD4NVQ2_PERFH|nr:transmembrane protein [Perilla frutescens var. hirtella]
MENGDDWLAADKLYHVLFCFSISIVSSLLAARTRYPFIRRRSIWIGSLISFAAGAAKEFADELGYFKSAGASSKDAAADLLGILIAALMLYLSNCRVGPDRPGQARELGMV